MYIYACMWVCVDGLVGWWWVLVFLEGWVVIWGGGVMCVCGGGYLLGYVLVSLVGVCGC